MSVIESYALSPVLLYKSPVKPPTIDLLTASIIILPSVSNKLPTNVPLNVSVAESYTLVRSLLYKSPIRLP